MFFRKSSIEPLPVTMSGVRMGERLLQIGVDDAKLIGRLASKVGLSGSAALVVDNEEDAARGRGAASSAGVHMDVVVTTDWSLPFESGSFDLIVVHSRSGWLGGSGPWVLGLRQAHRVLREGGRIVVIESAPRSGLAGLIRRPVVNESYASSGAAEGALRTEGFKPVRLLGEREGYRFTEGMKG